LYTGLSAQASQGDEPRAAEIPAAFKALEYLAGSWKGQGVPKNDPANKFRGWTESHSWSWVFKEGKPVALSLSVDGGRVLASGTLTYDPARKLYRLECVLPPPAAGPVHLEGTLDSTGKLLVLENVGKLPHFAGSVRLSIRPNANFIRYTIREDRKEPGGIQFSPFIEVGLTKEGESFASGATSAERAKCIITGAASTMSVTYQGYTYPVCCTGCRDEFLESPEKYIKKGSLMLKADAGKPKSDRPSSSRVTRFEDAFAGDVAETEGKSDAPAQPGPPTKSAMKTDAPKAQASTSAAKSTPESKPATKKQGGTAPSKDAARAASLLRVAQNLEKNGGAGAALTYYRRIVKDYPDTPAAKTAGARIKALGGR
jgi:YHS domain-containing protein